MKQRHTLWAVGMEPSSLGKVLPCIGFINTYQDNQPVRGVFIQ